MVKKKTDKEKESTESTEVIVASVLDPEERQTRLAKIGFLGVFFLLLLLNWALFQSIIHPIIFGAILAGTFAPLFNWLLTRTGMKREVCSALTCFVIVLVVILPLLYIVLQLSKESLTAYRIIRDGLSKEGVNDFLFGEGQLAQLIRSGADIFNIEFSPQELESYLLEAIRNFSSTLLSTLNHWIGNMAMIIFNFVIMMIVVFGLFVDGPKLKKFVFELSPLPNEQEQLIVEKFNQMNYVTLVCNGIGGILQGGLAAIGFYFAGIPSLFLWFTMMVLLAFIPLVGISFITVPTCIYLFLAGEQTTAIILLIYTASVSIIVENWFKPMFIGQRLKVNSILVLMYIIGGMAVFGMAGIFYGPLICIMFLTIVELYHNYYVDDFNGHRT